MLYSVNRPNYSTIRMGLTRDYLISVWCLLCVSTSTAFLRSFDPVHFFQRSFREAASEDQSGKNSCCYPTQFHADLFQVVGFDDVNHTSVEFNGTVNIDAGKRRFVRNLYSGDFPGGKPWTSRQIIFFDRGTQYLIDDAAKQCSNSSVKYTFDEWVDPCFKRATYKGDFTIGYKDSLLDSLLIKSFARDDPAGTVNFKRYVSTRNCAPVVDSTKMSFGVVKSLLTYYSNVVSRLDESAFVIPPFCGRTATDTGSAAPFDIWAMFQNANSAPDV